MGVNLALTLMEQFAVQKPALPKSFSVIEIEK